VVALYLNVRIRVRGDADRRTSFRLVTSAVRPPEPFLCSIPFLWGAGNIFLNMEKEGSFGRTSTEVEVGGAWGELRSHFVSSHLVLKEPPSASASGHFR